MSEKQSVGEKSDSLKPLSRSLVTLHEETLGSESQCTALVREESELMGCSWEGIRWILDSPMFPFHMPQSKTGWG